MSKRKAQDLPYRIHRYPGPFGWDYILCRYDADNVAHIIAWSRNHSQPVAPKAMRNIQARLNTKTVLG